MREFRFGQFRLDPARRELRHGDTPVPLQPKAFDCIAYLAEHRDRAVGRDELIAAVWGRTEISDNVLDQVMLRARRALGDTGDERRVLRTVPRFGFAWIAPTEVVDTGDEPAPRPLSGDSERIAAGLDTSPAPAPATDLADAPHSAPTRNNDIPRQKRASNTRIAIVLAVALLAVLGTVLVLRPSPPPPAAKPALASELALVLPVAIPAEAGFAWARLGAMDLIADHLRSAGQPMLPSDNVVALARELSGDAPDDAQLQALRDATAARTIFRAEARRSGDAWRVTLRSVAGRDPPLFAEAEAHELLEAAAATADRMAIELGLPPPQPQGDLVSPRERALHGLLQQVDAALLADQPDTARALLASVDVTQRALPDVRFRRAQVDFTQGRFEDAATELASLRDSGDDLDVHFRARVLNLLGNIASRRDDYAASERHSDTVIASLAGTPPSPELGRAWMGRAIARSAQFAFDDAVADFARARFVLDSVGDRLGVARVDANVGILEARRDRFAESLPLLEAAADRLAAFHDLNSELFVRVPAVYAHLAQLDAGAALALDPRLVTLIEREPNPKWVQYATLARIDLLSANGRLREAGDLLDGVRAAAADAGDTGMLGSANGIAARLALASDDPRTALRYSDALLSQPWEGQAPRERGSALLLQLRAQLAIDDAEAASGTAAALAQWAEHEPMPAARLYAALGQAATAVHANDAATARAAFDAAVQAGETTRVPADMLDACVPYAEWLIGLGAADDAGVVAARVAPWAGRDFAAALLQARVHHALAQSGPWRVAIERARALAGERTLPASLLTEP